MKEIKMGTVSIRLAHHVQAEIKDPAVREAVCAGAREESIAANATRFSFRYERRFESQNALNLRGRGDPTRQGWVALVDGRPS
jgi:hypothetical protein